jgi:DNA-binding transcriptional MerR regulator
VLTISQLAAYAGVTVRAVRHYHARGLLTEPPRDRSGYRRYGAQDVISLIRIKTLASAGVPLGRIRAMLDAGPAEYAEALRRVDEDLRHQIAELEAHRRDLAELDQPERVCLPPDAVEIQDLLRAVGLSERTLAHFRDGWILLAAVAPEELGDAVAWTSRWLEDQEYRRLLLQVDAAADWEPEDPRLETIAAAAVAMDERARAENRYRGDAPDETGLPHPLLDSFNAGASPAWGRLDELIEEIAADRPSDVPS